jgi:Ser/Thr protein kinase RdoA (MazF antagonist)
VKAFASLTGNGRARRLRALAWNAVQQYDLDVTHLRLITNAFNGIFRLDTVDGSKFILRVTLPEGGHDLDHIGVEMDWLAALARDTELSVPRPVPARNGRLVVTATANGVPESRLCEVFSWVKGKNLAEDMQVDNISHLGTLMAKLHLHALHYQPPTHLSILHFDCPFPFPEPVVLFNPQFSSLVTPERRKIFERAIAWTQESIDLLAARGEPMRIMHGDLHQWNVRNFHGKLSPIDFEDLMLGWPVQDIGTTLYYFPSNNYVDLRMAFQEGYTHCIPWPERHPGEVDSFIAIRGLGLVNYILFDPVPHWDVSGEELINQVEIRLRKLMEVNGIIW